MGTQQQLTTEQAELLVLIKELEDFAKEQPEMIPPGGIQEVIDSSNIMDPDELDKVKDVLKRYGYLDDDLGLTADGRQYVELFQEYLQEKHEKPEKPSVEHVSYSLINIENLKAALLKINIVGIALNFFKK